MPKALLVISFGTSFAETRAKTITAAENALAGAFPEYGLRRAFTSRVVIEKLKQRDGIRVDTTIEAIERLSAEGCREVLVQALHIINGSEYDSLVSDLAPYAERFTKLAIGRPLLTWYEDYLAVVNALREELPENASGEALVFMGHGSRHHANAAYAMLDTVFKEEGCPHVYMATVEGYPTLDSVVKRLAAEGIKKVSLLPFMLVAGEHARNDMAGDDKDSWKNILERKGFAVSTRLVGLGEIEGIRRIYVAHARAALENEVEW